MFYFLKEVKTILGHLVFYFFEGSPKILAGCCEVEIISAIPRFYFAKTLNILEAL